MIKLTATQSFLNNGNIVHKGDTITVSKSDVEEYVRRGLAVRPNEAATHDEHETEVDEHQAKKGRKSNAKQEH